MQYRLHVDLDGCLPCPVLTNGQGKMGRGTRCRGVLIFIYKTSTTKFNCIKYAYKTISASEDCTFVTNVKKCYLSKSKFYYEKAKLFTILLLLKGLKVKIIQSSMHPCPHPCIYIMLMELTTKYMYLYFARKIVFSVSCSSFGRFLLPQFTRLNGHCPIANRNIVIWKHRTLSRSVNGIHRLDYWTLDFYENGSL